MWDYNKLFAEGNIIGIKRPSGEIYNIVSNLQKRYAGPICRFCNDSLSFDAVDGKHIIAYIIHLDERGRINEKIFDRKRDMLKCVKLKTL